MTWPGHHLPPRRGMRQRVDGTSALGSTIDALAPALVPKRLLDGALEREILKYDPETLGPDLSAHLIVGAATASASSLPARTNS